MPSLTGDLIDVDNPRFWQSLHLLLEWGRSRRSAVTVGDLLTLPGEIGDMPEDVAAAWEQLATMPIETVPWGSPDALTAEVARRVTATVAQLGDRERHVFRARTLKMSEGAPELKPVHRSPTLEMLGATYGITRERVRQIQVRTEARVRNLLGTERSVRWLVTDVPTALGVAFPLDRLGAVPEFAPMVIPTGNAQIDENRGVAWRTVLWLANFSLTRDGWAVRGGQTPESLVLEVTSLGVERGSLSSDEAREALVAQGVVSSVVEVLLQQDPPGLRLFGDAYLPWGASLTDKAETILRWLHRPATTEEILEYADQQAVRRGLAQRLNEDDRFVKTGRSTYGLRSWGMETYSSISNEMAEWIERAGGRAPLGALVSGLTERFGVAESSVRVYAYSPRFVVEGGHVRLRHQDEPFELPRADPEEDQRVDRTEDGTFRYTISVIPDTLRGSGRLMPASLGLALGVTPGEKRTFEFASGVTVAITWPVTSPYGPSLGSVKALAEEVGAEIGDSLVLEFAPDHRTVTAERIPAEPGQA